MGLNRSRKRKAGRSRVKTVSALKKVAWRLLSELVRRGAVSKEGRVADCSCYTCGHWDIWTRMQAGHAIPGRTGSVLFDEEIIRPQCFACNIANHGRYEIFTTKLVQENGLDWWERKLSTARQVKKWSRTELEGKIEEYKKRLGEL